MTIKALLVAFWLAQGADIGTTVYGINHGCQEMNPLYTSRSAPAMVGIKGVATLTISLMAWTEHKRGNKTRARAMLLTGIAVGLGAGVWNINQIPHC